MKAFKKGFENIKLRGLKPRIKIGLKSVRRQGVRFEGSSVGRYGLKLRRSPMRGLVMAGVVFLGSFIFTALVSHFTKPTFNSEALIDPSSYHINISSVAKLGMKLETTPDGVMGSVKDTVNIKTNIPSGFKLFLSTNSDNTNSNRLNKDGSLSASHFVSASNGTVTAPKALTMNTWGFAIKKDSSNPFSTAFDDNYLTPFPSETSKWAGVGIKTAPNAILSTTSANDASGVNLDVYYGLRVNMSLPKGSYRSEVVYTALANLSSISGATVSSGYELEVAPKEIYYEIDGEQTITIKTSLFGKNGITTTGTGGSTTTQNPDLGTITATIGGTACIGLNSSLSSGMLVVTCKTPAKAVGKYEVKVSIPKHNIEIAKANAFDYKKQTTFNSITTMQQMTAQICSSETTPHVYENGASSGNVLGTTTREHSTSKDLVPEAHLKDTRDNKIYVIRKLADGKCWMVQNLDLDLSTGTALTSSTSDVSSNWTPQNSTQSNTGVVWGSGSSWQEQNQQASSSARSYNPGDKYLTGTGSANQTVGNSGPKTAHVGNLYNWYAATAGSGTYNMSTPGQSASYSICPKGWKLPYGNNSQSYTADSGDFRKLTNTYGITSGSSTGSSDSRLLSAPLSFVRSGFYDYSNGSYYAQGSGGYFWSSSVYNQNLAHSLYFGSSYVYPQNFNDKGNGFSVRCVARESGQTTFNSITTMQEMTPQICANETKPNVSAITSTKIHSSDKNLVPEAELKDVRDGKTYVVRKLADGKCWMVQNLDLDLSTGTALSSSTSDVSSNWTPNNNTQTSIGTSWSNDTSDNQARSYNPGDKYLTGTGSANQTVSNSGPKTAHVGNLYNWYAATAGSGTYSMSTTGQEASHSICPKGWKLPYGNNSTSQTENYGDFRKLTNTYGITSGANYTNNNVTLADKLISAPLNFVRSGLYSYSNGSYSDRGSNGFFWSSSVYNQSTAHSLNFRSSYVNPQLNHYKGYGFSVRCVAKESGQTTFNSITTMQEMTPQICANETKPNVSATTSTKIHSTDKNLVPEAELKDTRDGKTYVVRKLADGKCWMVQNLDLDLSTGTALTSATSDVSSNWTPNNSTQNSAGTSWGEYNNPTNQARSYNPGDKYLTGTGSASQTVSDSGPKTAHVGNLYNWYAATAGSGTYNMSTTGQEASHSICPKGWKLPYGNNSQSQTENYGDFRKLINTYGITSGAGYGAVGTALADKLISAPLSFVRSGYYYYSDGSYENQGSNGAFWSSSVYSQDYAHTLFFRSSYVYLQDNDNKGVGFSVRCLAR